MFLANSDESFGTTTGGSAAPRAEAPFLAPTYVYSLKFLSLTVPTSVATPIFHLVLSVGNTCVAPLWAVAPAHGFGAVEAAADGPALLEHADAMTANPASRVNPIERVRMLPPPSASDGSVTLATVRVI